MNILLRHTLSSITRNPVQSVIVVVSTAMITACVLLCLCVSSLFEFTTRLWADYLFGGSQMIVNTSPQHQDEVREWLEAHDDVAAYIMTYDVSATVMSEDATVRAFGSANEFGALDTYDRLISAVVLDRTENTTSLPSAHISADFAEVLGLSVGDTFTVKGNGEFFVEAVCAATSRYYSNPLPAYAYETDGLPSVTARFSVWFTDAEAALEDDNATIAAYREELCAITQDKSSVNTAIASNLAEADASVEGSMRLMNIAASVISVVMACLLLASFSVIVRGRVNELIKFKAAGATPAQSAFILIVEAALYAVVGGLIGLGIGEGLILYLNGTLPAGIEAAIVPNAGDYFVALAIGAACGLAACALPAVRMSFRSIHHLLGGTERMTARTPVWSAVVVTLLTFPCCIAAFFVPTEMLLPFAVASVALSFVWFFTVLPHVLALLCAAARRLTRPGAGYIAECACPRTQSVSTSFSVLTALIAFITLGAGIIDTVILTGVPSQTRYTNDFVATVVLDGTVSPEDELERCLAVDGITDGALYKEYSNCSLAYADGTPISENSLISAVNLMAVQKGSDLRFASAAGIPDDVIRRFDELVATGGHPAVITYYTAERYGFEIGDSIAVLTKTSEGILPLNNTYTIVGIDETLTAWDQFIFVCDDDIAVGDYVLYYGAAIRLDGDTTRFSELRSAIDTDRVTLFTNEGYTPVASSGDDTTRMLSVFSYIIYIIAALGLVNLIVITARERMKEFDIFRLAGMNASDAARYIFTETAVLTLGGAALGMLFASFMGAAVRGIAQVVDKYIPLDPLPASTAVTVAVGVGLFALLWALAHLAAFAGVNSPLRRRRDDRMLRSG